MTGHSIITSFEPGENWFYDFASEQEVPGAALAPPDAHPASQPAPGPIGKVPRDWESRLH